MAEEQFIRGVPFPNNEDLLLVENDIQQRLNTNPAFAAAYNDDNQVREVLGAYGISEDVQVEYLKNKQRPAPASKCLLTCWTTCWFTSCALTSFS